MLAFLKHKGWRPAFSYKDVWGEEHAFAFTVAKAMEMDVLTAIREALEKALAEGIPFERFKTELEPRLREMGWWGVKRVDDPLTGKKVPAQLGSPRRLKTIYWANLRSARSAGQWERAQRTKAGLPYFIYCLGASEHHRPEHAAKSGLILPIDDPFWDSWMPQNGWGCKCRVRQIGAAEATRKGGVGTAPTVPTRTWRNSRTGEVLRVPEGIDPAWDTNPGKHRQANLDRVLAGKIAEMPDDLARVAIRDMEASGRFAGALAMLGDGQRG
ncbi:MAG: hypothetical protein EPN20_15940 [Magnetospirillum sp.]|nr:MAG: hypothetical protein EPN20_15940 [Magnetospirillum sp.]